MKSWKGLVAVVSMLLSVAVQAKEIKATYNELTVNANVVMAEGKDWSDSVVLLLHGTTTHNGRETYKSIQKLLAESGVSSIAPNLSLNVSDRHGEVDCSRLQTHRHQDSLNEVDFWLSWLEKKGASDVTLIGHSRGGNQIAWHTVERESDLVKRAVLIAPQTWSKEAMFKEYQKKYDQALPALLNKAEKLVKAGNGSSVLKPVNFIYCKDSQVTAEAFVSYYRPDERMDTPTLLKKAVKPTLVMIGSADNVVADLEAKMDGVDNELVSSYVVEDADHFFLDLFAEELVEQVVSFMEQ